MPRETAAQLRARIDELEAQNASLELQRDALNQTLAEGAARVDGPPPGAVAGAGAAANRKHVGRSILAAVLIVLGVIVTPLSIFVGFAQQQVTDTDAFVATYAPLAQSPAVQEVVTSTVTQGITNAIDFDAIVGVVVDGAKELGLGSAFNSSLDLFRGPIVSGIESVVGQVVSGIVTSDVFAQVWEQSLRLTHSQLNASLRGDDNAVALIDGDQFSIQLGPVIDVVKGQLGDSGFGFVTNLIPDGLDIQVPIAQVEGLGQLRIAYAALVGLGFWLPIVAIVLLVAGIAVAPRRRGWTIGAGISVGVIMLIIGIALSIGRTAIIASDLLTDDSAAVIYDTAVGALASSVLAVGILALVVAVVAWIAGPGRASSAVRGVLAFLPSKTRQGLDRSGASRGAFGLWLERYRGLLYWAIAAIAVLILVFGRPLTAVGVVLTAVGAIVLLFVIEALRAGPPAPVAGPSVQGSAPVDEDLADLPA